MNNMPHPLPPAARQQQTPPVFAGFHRVSATSPLSPRRSVACRNGVRPLPYAIALHDGDAFAFLLLPPLHRYSPAAQPLRGCGMTNGGERRFFSPGVPHD